MGRLIALMAITLATGLHGTGSAVAQTWPTRPITMVVAFAAGSGDDVFARILAPRLSEVLGQQVIIENIGGAGGMTGTARVAKAAPDGYQFVLGGTGTFGANQTLYKNPLYNAVTDFEPVLLIGEQPLLVQTRKDFPANNLGEFITYAKANQSKLQFGSGGAGSATHLPVCCSTPRSESMSRMCPSRGRAWPPRHDRRPHRLCVPDRFDRHPAHRGRHGQTMANLSRDRSPLLPNIATAHEQGLTDLDAFFWSAFFLPKRTPPPIVQKLREATLATMETPAVQQRLKEIAANLVAPERRTTDYLQKFVESEIAKWAGPIKASGVSMD
jgi:tripartite-type tricarboxylate transporter receptor subunit TctC